MYIHIYIYSGIQAHGSTNPPQVTTFVTRSVSGPTQVSFATASSVNSGASAEVRGREAGLQVSTIPTASIDISPRHSSDSSLRHPCITATRKAHDILPRRVLELRSEHNVFGGDKTASGKTNTRVIHSSQPTTSNAEHHELIANPNSQLMVSTNVCFSPRRTRSQGRTKDFRQL